MKSYSSKESRKRAGRMMKGAKKGYIRTTGRIMKYGFKGFFRNLWLSTASILMLVITLLALIATAATNLVLQDTAMMIREKMDSVIFIKPGVKDEVVEEMRLKLKENKNIKEIVAFTSKDEAKKVIDGAKGDKDLIKVLNSEDFLNTLILKTPAIIRFKMYEVEKIGEIKSFVESDELFLENIDTTRPPTFDTNRKEMERVLSWAEIARMVGFGLAIVFLVISILVVSNTVRMAIFSRREEIYMMKLVGADKRFIRGPFLFEVQISGFLAAMIAIGLGYALIMLFLPGIENYGINVSTLKEILSSEKLSYCAGAVMAVGILIPTLAARFSIRRHLNK